MVGRSHALSFLPSLPHSQIMERKTA
jgi:hypothetical protein